MKIAIIGGGPAGIEAALTASQFSQNVTLITNSVEWKSALPNLWLHHVDDIKKHQSFSLPHLFKKRDTWVQSVAEHVQQTNIQLLHGQATFKASNLIKVIHENGHQTNLLAEKVIIATGSRPLFPEKIMPDAKRIFSFENLRRLHTIPSSIIIIGGSPIGFEMVHLFQQLGSKVKWLLPETMLPFDPDILTYIKKYWQDNVDFIRGPFVETLSNRGDYVIALREDGERFEAEMAFVTVGFTPNLDHLNLHHVNLNLQARGTINVNEFFQTDNEHIYVVGDAYKSSSSVYSRASAQLAALHACQIRTSPLHLQSLPLSFNENPQVATVGNVNNTNMNVKTVKIPYDTMQFRAHMTDNKDGFLKMIFDQQGTVIGGTCVGSQAKEIITIVALMIKLKTKAEDVQFFFSSHPSVLELPFTLIRNYYS